MRFFRLTLIRALLFTWLFIALWLGFTISFDGIGLVDQICWAILYLIGLAWVVYLVETTASEIETDRTNVQHETGWDAGSPEIVISGEVRTVRQSWNPLDPAARFYNFWVSTAFFGVLLAIAVATLLIALQAHEREEAAKKIGLGGAKSLIVRISEEVAIPSFILAMVALASAFSQSKRLRQTLGLLATYSLWFAFVYFVVHFRFGSGDEISADLPAGGGVDSIKASTVKVKKIIRKKYVINPYSTVVFNAEIPIDKVELNLNAETAHQNKAGSGPGGLGRGKGKGGGFGSGTGSGKIQLFRLRHSDRSWNKNFGIGGDLNLLAEMKARNPEMAVANEVGQVDTTGVAHMSAKKPYPLIHIAGAQSFSMSAADKKALKEYLIDKHGMIFGDNLGGTGFHNAFINVMTEITGVNPVPVPRDDYINQKPYALPNLPIVVAHGGTIALGWKIDGRWAVYYHPGALSDAWRDDHAGIRKDVYELCYQLGINILYYAYSEQDKWRSPPEPEP